MITSEAQREAVKELINIIQDAKGIMAWTLGKSFANGEEYWVNRISEWLMHADNDTLIDLRERTEGKI